MGSTGPLGDVANAPTAFDIVPPVIGTYFIKRTGRIYYKV